MKKIFRVLVIDDNKKVLDGLPKRLTTYDRVFEGRNYSIDLVPIHIGIKTNVIDTETNKSISEISSQTLQKLKARCKTPFSLILADFGYVTEEVINSLDAPANGKEFTKSDLEGKILTTADLAKAAEKISVLKKNFVNSNAKFYLYSYLSKKFYSAYGSMSDRVNLTNSWFRNSEVVPVDTKDEFYGGEEFNSLYNPEYYAHQASRLINRIVQHEFVEFILKDSQRRGHTRLKQLASIISIGVIVGFTSEWLGGRLFSFYEKGDFTNGIVFGLCAVVVLIFVGIVISNFVERSIIECLLEDVNEKDLER
jgi:hypothetical protein